jgi:hypothetical protein
VNPNIGHGVPKWKKRAPRETSPVKSITYEKYIEEEK